MIQHSSPLWRKRPNIVESLKPLISENYYFIPEIVNQSRIQQPTQPISSPKTTPRSPTNSHFFLLLNYELIITHLHQLLFQHVVLNDSTKKCGNLHGFMMKLCLLMPFSHKLLIPTLFCKALSSLEALQWYEAMEVRCNSLINNNTWTLMDWLVDWYVVSTKWLFWRKYNLDSTLAYYKAYFVA